VTFRTAALAVLTAALAVAVSGCGSASSSDAGGSSSSSKSASASASASSSPAASDSASATPTAAPGACTWNDSGQPAARKVDKPGTKPLTGKVKVTIGTNFGKSVAVLDAASAPCATTSFASLAKQGYYDKTTCTRVAYTSGKVAILQCGDPSGTQSGGPGYQFAEEVTGKEVYGPGVIAMANSGQPGSTGGQFFVCLDTSQYPPDYTIIGKLTDAGLAVWRKAATAALKGQSDGYDGKPATPVNLTKVRPG
jgi:peptidyl-prolyl cis-trans isomerase B (cyclophilin B)